MYHSAGFKITICLIWSINHNMQYMIMNELHVIHESRMVYNLYLLLVISAAILYLVTTKSSDMFPTSSLSATMLKFWTSVIVEQFWFNLFLTVQVGGGGAPVSPVPGSQQWKVTTGGRGWPGPGLCCDQLWCWITWSLTTNHSSGLITGFLSSNWSLPGFFFLSASGASASFCITSMFNPTSS